MTLHMICLFKMSVNTRAPLVNTVMNFCCEIVPRDTDPDMYTAMILPIFSVSKKEGIIFFVKEHERHFKKDEKLSATV